LHYHAARFDKVGGDALMIRGAPNELLTQSMIPGGYLVGIMGGFGSHQLLKILIHAFNYYVNLFKELTCCFKLVLIRMGMMR
jgi:hypothetical protein